MRTQRKKKKLISSGNAVSSLLRYYHHHGPHHDYHHHRRQTVVTVVSVTAVILTVLALLRNHCIMAPITDMADWALGTKFLPSVELTMQCSLKALLTGLHLRY